DVFSEPFLHSWTRSPKLLGESYGKSRNSRKGIMKTSSIMSLVLICSVVAWAAPQATPEVFTKITKAPKELEPEATIEEVTESTTPVVESFPAPGVEPSPTPSPAPATTAASGVPAEQALRWLMNGNVRYVKNRFRADGR